MGRAADGQRGKLPEILADQDTITFVMTIAERDGIIRKLVLRCERGGEIFSSIRLVPKDPTASPDPSNPPGPATSSH